MSSQQTSLSPPGGRRHRGTAELYCEIGGLPVEVRFSDFSRAGLFVQTPMPPEQHDELELFLRSAAGSITLHGQVVQVISCEQAATERRRPGFGLLFTHLSDAQRAWIAATLNASATAAERPGGRGVACERAPLAQDSPKASPSARPRPQPEHKPKPRPARKKKPVDPALERLRKQTLSDLHEHLSQIQNRAPWMVLGVDADASADASRSAFLSLSKRYHPHLYARYDSREISQAATDIFIATKRAYTTMSKCSKPPHMVSGRPRTSLSAQLADTPKAPGRRRVKNTKDATAEIRVTAAIKLLTMGQLREAEIKLKGALELDPTNEPGRLWLAVCEARQLKAQGRGEEAVERYRAVLEIDPGHREALEATAGQGDRKRAGLLGRFFGSDGKS